MVFKCQEDSFLRQFTCKVLSCEVAKLEWIPTGETSARKLEGYNVICEDTIIFPEGGGQPCDYGQINGYPVRSVVRKGTEAIHFVESTKGFEEGDIVKQELDWNRRLDHMQQHSGQHLITALFDSEFKYDTTSWWLGTDTSYIELDTTHLITRASLDLIEQKANELIREGREVSVQLVDPEIAKEFQDARAPRGLPKDHVGLARVVRIEGVESNMCCGTHVSNLSQLQSIKLLYAEKVKNAINVHFVVGERVLRKLGEIFQREQQMNLALKGGPTQHLELIQKLQLNLKSSTKAFQKLLKDVAISEAERLENTPQPYPKYYCLHRKDGIEPDFINTFLRNAPEGIFYFLTVSENSTNNGKGLMVLRGNEEDVKKFGELFMELLQGKGNGRESNFQGKFNNGSKIPECNAILEKHFNGDKSKK
ncbi:alanyl-tRNA editing protein Aarsd1-B [Bactrocera neohumeralis]|uniref:alanyl-tRNA editing protein Aarsd1-B n=1 Tax=Bactrocera tryoni TaxID=59916 RepID=UPI001A98C5EC|nr:alanyl-tRNA editing protein Aarsd1-B [Bactrocera tryoni]XP_050328624.1 alanyl-tRNA editing protein Aarsd1-B [Bactrocera neohumeralis]